jgi:hypothetical protein
LIHCDALLLAEFARDRRRLASRWIACSSPHRTAVRWGVFACRSSCRCRRIRYNGYAAKRPKTYDPYFGMHYDQNSERNNQPTEVLSIEPIEKLKNDFSQSR